MFGCGGALARGEAFSQAWNHLWFYVPCYDSLMVLVTGGGGGRRRLIRVQTLLTDLWRRNHRAGIITVKKCLEIK